MTIITRRTLSGSLLAFSAATLTAVPALAKDRGKLVARARELLRELESIAGRAAGLQERPRHPRVPLGAQGRLRVRRPDR